MGSGRPSGYGQVRSICPTLPGFTPGVRATERADQGRGGDAGAAATSGRSTSLADAIILFFLMLVSGARRQHQTGSTEDGSFEEVYVQCMNTFTVRVQVSGTDQAGGDRIGTAAAQALIDSIDVLG